MPDNKDVKKAPLDGVISKAAMQEITTISKELLDFKKDHTKAEVNLQVERIVAVVAADLDVADGKADYVIDKDLFKTRAHKLLKGVAGDMLHKASGIDIVEKVDKAIDGLPTVEGTANGVSSKALVQKVLRKTEGMVDAKFKDYDLNRDNVISVKEMDIALKKAMDEMLDKAKGKIGKLSISVGQHVEECPDGACRTPSAVKQGVAVPVR